MEEHTDSARQDASSRRRFIGSVLFVLLGGVLIVNSFILEWTMGVNTLPSQCSAVLGALVLALPIIYTAVRDLVRGLVHMNELVALAVLAAMASGDFRNAGIIGFILLLALIIESRTASGAQRSIEELLKLTPGTATKVEGGREREVGVAELASGDLIRIRPGENFPVDGIVKSGASTVNQSSITGESVPLEKVKGDEVFAGTQNLSGSVDVEVTKVGADTTLGKVKDMIISAERSRTPMVRLIDRYAGFYTPAVLMIAGVTWFASPSDLAMDRVITLLVISCPIAVVLSTPTAVVAAVAAAARLGIFIKNISHLELAGKVGSFVFDKTGTLTDGMLSVVKLGPAGSVTPAELLLVAASCDFLSRHPTALALVKLAQEAGIKLEDAVDFTEEPGKGVSARLGADRCLVGRASYLKEHKIALPEHDGKESDNMSVVYVVRSGTVLGFVGFRDKLRPEAPEMIAGLRELGVRRCSMVTGDRESVAKAVADQLGIDEYRSECLPDGKVDYVEELKKSSVVAVVGDGVNDAPALAAGDLGIAMGAIGSDIAVNSASIALMTNDLRRIPMLVFLSRRSRLVISQNLFLGLVVVVGGMTLALTGQLSPVGAALLHTASSLLVIFNSARLVRTGEELTGTEVER